MGAPDGGGGSRGTLHFPRSRVQWSNSTGAHLDNLTHSLVGAAISKAGAERMTPLATATLVIAANAPDLDVLSYARGEYFALAFRRGVTHGLPAIALLTLLVTAAILAWDRAVRRPRDPNAEAARAGPVFALSGIGLLTHPSLDWLNTYGMRWGLPFDPSWTYGDALFIVDPWIWLALGGAVFLTVRASRAGLVAWGALAATTTLLVVTAGNAAIAAVWLLGLGTIIGVRVHGERDPRGRLPAAALVGVTTYMGSMIAADSLARVQVAAAAEDAGLHVEDLMVAPRPGNPLVADVEVRTSASYVPGIHRWLASPRVELHEAQAVPLLAAPGLEPASLVQRVIAVARQRAAVRDYLIWSRYPYVRVTPEEGGWAVRFSDARYDGRPGAGGLAGVGVHVSISEVR
jgi:inner membrane protein